MFSKSKRSAIMSSIRDKATKQEIMVRSFLFRQGFRFRKNDKRYPGKPDIVLPKYQCIVFVNGCFWHGHTCKAAKLPQTRKEFWQNKIAANANRDSANQKQLENMGWNVVTVWQCELTSSIKREKRYSLLMELILQTYRQ